MKLERAGLSLTSPFPKRISILILSFFYSGRPPFNPANRGGALKQGVSNCYSEKQPSQQTALGRALQPNAIENSDSGLFLDSYSVGAPVNVSHQEVTDGNAYFVDLSNYSIQTIQDLVV